MKCLRRLLIPLFILVLAAGASAAVAETNILYNADFSIPSAEGGLPDGWEFDAWDATVSDAYAISEAAGKVVVVENSVPSDARVVQRIAVEPNTCYRFSCEVQGVGIIGGKGATISILDTFVGSDAVFDTDGYTTLSFTGMTDAGQTEIILALRVGGYGELSGGAAKFRNVFAEKLDDVPASAQSLKTAAPGSGDEKTEDAQSTAWPLILLLTLVVALLGALFYYRGVLKARSRLYTLESDRSAIWLLLLAALMLRALFSVIFVGHYTDISCFKAWAEMMAEYGPGGFYTTGTFADYPPGYMYVLWLIGWIRRLFSLSYDSALFIFLLKLPAIIADLVSAWLVYKLARRCKLSRGKCHLLFIVVLFHPVFAFISGGWGQIDSILTLAFVGVFYLFHTGKRIPAGALFGIAILIKPQALMLGPLLAIMYLMPEENRKYWKTLLQAALSVLAACAVIALLALPFSGGQEANWLVEKYFSTATSYPYASVEAFNLFALFGGNWEPITDTFLIFSYGTWGYIGIAVSVVLAGWLYIRVRKTDAVTAAYLAGAFLFIALFTLGPYMHERYVYPALLLLFIAAIRINDRRLYASFIIFSITLFLNAACAFYVVANQFARGTVYDIITYLGSLGTVAGFVYLCYTCYRIAWKGDIKESAMKETPEGTADEDGKHQPPQAADYTPLSLEGMEPFDKKLRFTKRDRLYCLSLTLVYAIFALTNLGSTVAPESAYESSALGETVTISLDGTEELAELWVFGGIAEGEAILTGDSGAEATYTQEFDEMYRWASVPVSMPTERLELMTASGRLNILEIAMFDAEGERVTPKNVSSGGEALFDEQDTIPEVPSYYNGMYFDELYHARTAYEHLHGLEPYENSHPPLGKVFIMLGIAVFGMNAFGWRIVGAIFGIIMVPVFYAFARRIFKRADYALVASALFAFDFMHFTQTRIATIDVYALFFILLMYYYMYQYYCMNIFVDGLRATLKPLALAGLFFGLGAASKWICIYAGAGLAVLLFTSLTKRFLEYRAIMKGDDEAQKSKVRAYPKYLIQTLLFCCIFYIVVPVAIYIASYIPYFLCEKQYGMKEVWGYQEFMWRYHSQLQATHPYQSAWWQWPFTLRPMWYYFNYFLGPDRISTLTASGNPAVWWVCTVLTIGLILQRIRARAQSFRQNSPGLTVIFVGMAANYLPWVLITRCTFIYHFFATVPFIIFAGLMFLYRFETNASRLERHPKIRYLKWIWMGAALLLFLLMYPGISGLEVPMAYARVMRYLPGGALFYGA